MNIDASGVGSVPELHELLAERLGFPEFYGHNWAAFWDCIRDPQLSTMPDYLRITGWLALQGRMEPDAKIIKKALEDAALQSDFSVEYVDS